MYRFSNDSFLKERFEILFTTPSRGALGPTQPPIQWVLGPLSRVTKPGIESNHSPPSSADIKKAWSDTYTSPYNSIA